MKQQTREKPRRWNSDGEIQQRVDKAKNKKSKGNRKDCSSHQSEALTRTYDFPTSQCLEKFGR